MPATRARDTQKQSEDKSQSNKKRGSRTRAGTTVEPYLTAGSTRFLQRCLSNARTQSVSGQQAINSTGHTIQCK